MTRVIDTRTALFKKPAPAKRRSSGGQASLSPRLVLRGLLGLALGSSLLLMALRWEVQTIRVRNASVTDLEGVAEVLRPYLGSPLLFADRGAMAQLLREDPWVCDVRVRIQPPETVLLDVDEARPMFRLADGGAIDDLGRQLPARAGLDLSALPLLRFARWDDFTQSQFRQLTAALREVPWNTGAALRELRIESSGTRLALEDGVEVRLGRAGHRERLARLGAARAQLSPKSGDVLDLRFARQIVLTHGEG